jgi:hypothetical protein
MNTSLAPSPISLGLPSFLKPQARWVPQIASQVARLGTLAALGYTGYQAFANSGYSLADTSPAGLLQNAAIVVSPVLISRLNSTAAGNLATRALWNPIRKETLKDPDQAINRTVLASAPLQESVGAKAMAEFNDFLASVKKKALTDGLLYAGLGTFLTVSYLNQFG